MRRVARRLAFAVFFLQLTFQMQAQETANQPPRQPHSVSIWRVRRALVASITKSYSYSYIAEWVPSSFRFSIDSFEFDAKLSRKKALEHFTVDLKSLPQVFPKRGALGHYRVKDQAGRDLPSPLNRMLFTEEVAPEFASAINRLRAFSQNSSEIRHNFAQQAAMWRALPSKPPLPEEVRTQRLLAENAVKEKQFEKALDYYETGLAILPTWPQGYFNASLIAAELGFYDEAVDHMQTYLELVPDAPDAQSARDQIVIWQSKAKEK